MPSIFAFCKLSVYQIPTFSLQQEEEKNYLVIVNLILTEGDKLEPY